MCLAQGRRDWENRIGCSTPILATMYTTVLTEFIKLHGRYI